MLLKNKIRELAAILEEEGLGEIEVRTWWRTIRVSSKPCVEQTEESSFPPPVVQTVTRDVAGPATGAETAAAAAVSAPEEREEPSPASQEEEKYEQILAPMVGTFYAASNPQSDPFVSPGTRVEVGQVLCIIEAMKLMNEIEAETSGIIRKVLARDAQPIEFGQPLFLIESA